MGGYVSPRNQDWSRSCVRAIALIANNRVSIGFFAWDVDICPIGHYHNELGSWIRINTARALGIFLEGQVSSEDKKNAASLQLLLHRETTGVMRQFCLSFSCPSERSQAPLRYLFGPSFPLVLVLTWARFLKARLAWSWINRLNKSLCQFVSEYETDSLPKRLHRSVENQTNGRSFSNLKLVQVAGLEIEMKTSLVWD